MKCPHCLTEFHDNNEYFDLGEDVDGDWGIQKLTCPNPTCKRSIFYLINGTWIRHMYGFNIHNINTPILIRPKISSRNPLPPEVTEPFKSEYSEACIVLHDSPKASAALSRRCLQLILREKGGVKKGDLANEIQQVIDSGKLPTHLSESIDAIRNIGNFAAHPLKSQSTGEIVPVEAGEADWNLEVIEMLFDFYFVQPERTKQRRAALNSKLNELGKPQMK